MWLILHAAADAEVRVHLNGVDLYPNDDCMAFKYNPVTRRWSDATGFVLATGRFLLWYGDGTGRAVAKLDPIFFEDDVEIYMCDSSGHYTCISSQAV